MMKWPSGLTGLSLKLTSLAAIVGVLGVGIMNLAHADPGWPTPPPAPPAVVPIIESEITPVAVPLVDGATRWEVQPIPQGVIPAIPPLNSDVFEAPGHLRVTIEAGALDRTIQLTYVPVPVDKAPAPHRLQRLLTAFDLKSFDHRGRPFQPTFRRPWILEVSVRSLPDSAGDPGRLVFSRFEEGRWLPLVTTYFRHEDVLVTRILKTGRFAILAERPPS